MPSTLILPESYEEATNILGTGLARMSQFVEGVPEAETAFRLRWDGISHAGRIVFLLGETGIGKSTFIRSLTWNPYVKLAEIEEINAFELGARSERLERLFDRLLQYGNQIRSNKKHAKGVVVVNNLEDLSGQTDDAAKAFFRDINGLLRQVPLLVVWPVTQRVEAARMIDLAGNVASTIFGREPIIDFQGPDPSSFPDIAKNTIEFFNPKLTHDDFLLTDADFDEVLATLKKDHVRLTTIRNYLGDVNQRWNERSGYFAEIIGAVPYKSEVWFVVCFPEAEDVVSTFARKTGDIETNWDSHVTKFAEYIGGQQQVAAGWNASRLSVALRGAFKVKVMYVPTHAVVSSVLAFGGDGYIPTVPANVRKAMKDELKKASQKTIAKSWPTKSAAKNFIKTSPVARQLNGEVTSLGMRRGPVRTSAEFARTAFKVMNDDISSPQGSDQPYTYSVARALEAAASGKLGLQVEKPHPYLPAIRPDIQITRTNAGRTRNVCIEFFYSADSGHANFAYYVLKKMRAYVDQLETYLSRPLGH